MYIYGKSNFIINIMESYFNEYIVILYILKNLYFTFISNFPSIFVELTYKYWVRKLWAIGVWRGGSGPCWTLRRMVGRVELEDPMNGGPNGGGEKGA